ncbi:hypothetical protein LTR37_002694 [Vermiconidia calcicola]|uniref:Uncharacterized protein n=1 Tax=Vermiconidia calcicola TaxID=1690605 RepID=A0ACC3NSS5_9PEZI|nr:hypothetical protein LTR37_002694 [Vermiconidia calcicola]
MHERCEIQKAGAERHVTTSDFYRGVNRESRQLYRSGTPSLSVPQTQNTALVLEFNCLYTHDVRRKQKRWQDGFLRFHTFNKRVMVYDVPRNFIGDAHWKAEEALQDGDEVTLEKDGVIVQVAESVGQTETDLTELRLSSKKKSSSEHGSSPMRPAQTPARIANGTEPKPTTQLKHRSLNTLLGTPKGPIGKAALPSRSPFEQRHARIGNEEWENDRPPKRQRTEQPAAWNVTRTSKPTRVAKPKETPLWARTTDSAKAKKKRAPVPPGQRKLGTKEVIDLFEDADEHDKFLPGFSSDALVPPSSPKQPALLGKQPAVRSSSPVFEAQKAQPKAQIKYSTCVQTRPDAHSVSRQPNPADPMSVRDTGRESDAARHGRRDREVSEEPLRPPTRSGDSSAEPPKIKRPPRSKSGQTLRVAASAPKKRMLLCQDQLPKRPSRVHSANTESAIGALLDVTAEEVPPAEKRSTSQRKQLQERLARIGKKTVSSKEYSVAAGKVDKAVLPSTAIYTGFTRSATNIEEPRPQTANGQDALTLADLDQMIMPPELPRSPETGPPVVKDTRELRRVVSESNKPPSSQSKRAPGAPVRFTPTPSPSKKSPPKALHAKPAEPDNSSTKPVTAVPPKLRAKKPIQRAVSLNTASNGTSAVILSKAFRTPKAPEPKQLETARAPEPWSREAFDLFTWRPPGWDEDGWCLKPTTEGLTAGI